MSRSANRTSRPGMAACQRQLHPPNPEAPPTPEQRCAIPSKRPSPRDGRGKRSGRRRPQVRHGARRAPHRLRKARAPTVAPDSPSSPTARLPQPSDRRRSSFPLRGPSSPRGHRQASAAEHRERACAADVSGPFWDPFASEAQGASRESRRFAGPSRSGRRVSNPRPSAWEAFRLREAIAPNQARTVVRQDGTDNTGRTTLRARTRAATPASPGAVVAAMPALVRVAHPQRPWWQPRYDCSFSSRPSTGDQPGSYDHWSSRAWRALVDDAVVMKPDVRAGMALAAGRHNDLLRGAPADSAPAS